MTRRLVRDGQLHDSRYRVERELGSGGMATVYLARDLKHDRLVALKILSTELAAVLGPDRFLREIRLTAGLDHPHILPLLDSGQTGGLLYYAMPYVEGESLRQRLDRESQLSLEEALRVTREVGDALAHAHARGIIHRDVKPENILLAAGSPGHARLADFGIARVVHTAGGDTLTSAGVAIGTPLYMSPEQSGGGNALGPSSDVYSLACVLYEMLAGHPPYLGATPGAILVRKATEPMPGLRLVRPAVPEGVEAALRRALSPVPVDRYPDVAAFLEALDLTGGEAPMAAAPGPRSRRAWRLAAAGGAVAAFVAAVALLVLRSDRGVVPAYEPLTSFDDLVSWPRLSPDGRQLAFMRGGQLYVKPMPDGEPVRLTDDPVAKRRPAFSPDGSRIAFDRGEEVWVIPALGGTPRLLLANATALTWADPQHLLFSERRTGIHLVVVTSDESRGGLRDIYVPPTDQGMAHESYLSPDRRHVLVQEMDATGDLPCRVVPFRGGSGPGERVGPPGGACRGGTWSADGRWIYLSVTIGGQTHLWRQRFPGGTPEQITFGATWEMSPSAIPSGDGVVATIGMTHRGLWLKDGGGERRVTEEALIALPSIARNRRSVYYLVRNNGGRAFIQGELWRAELSSGQREPLLPGIALTHYAIAPDGEHVAYTLADAEGESALWLARLDRRRPPRRLVETGAHWPYFTPDGAILYVATDGPSKFLTRLVPDRGPPERILDLPVAYFVNVSPDGKWAALWMSTPVEGEMAVVLHPVRGGEPITVCGPCGAWYGSGQGAPMVGWDPDQSRVLFSTQYLQGMGQDRTVVVPLAPGTVLPPLPAEGISTEAELLGLPGAVALGEADVFAIDEWAYLFIRTIRQGNAFLLRFR